MHAFAGGRALD